MQPWNIQSAPSYFLFKRKSHAVLLGHALLHNPNTYEHCELSSKWFQQMSPGTGGTPADERERLGPPLAVIDCEL